MKINEVIMMKEKIAEMLYQNLGAVYCYSCEYGDFENEDMCEDCHRKYMNWALSHKAADGLAEEVMRIINEG